MKRDWVGFYPEGDPDAPKSFGRQGVPLGFVPDEMAKQADMGLTPEAWDCPFCTDMPPYNSADRPSPLNSMCAHIRSKHGGSLATEYKKRIESGDPIQPIPTEAITIDGARIILDTGNPDEAA